MKIGIVGLGKLGLPMAAAFSWKRHRVVGVDVDAGTVSRVRDNAFVREALVNAILKEFPIEASADFAALDGCDLVFVVVPTPSKADGSFSDEHVREAVEVAGRNSGGLVIVCSTVTPGTMDGLGLPRGCYNPQLVALGSIVHDVLYPPLVIIGESDAGSGDRLETFYATLLSPGVFVARTNFVNAEIAKVALNAYVTMKISFANELADLCERVPGAHIDRVTDTLGHDPRIGSKCLRGATPYGGPCFPRDNRAYAAFAEREGVELFLPPAADDVNRSCSWRLMDLVLGYAPPGTAVHVSHRSYKLGTGWTEGAWGNSLAEILEGRGAVLTDRPEDAEVVVIALPEVPLAVWKEGQIVVDCWRVLDGEEVRRAGAKYVAVGVHDDGV